MTPSRPLLPAQIARYEILTVATTLLLLAAAVLFGGQAEGPPISEAMLIILALWLFIFRSFLGLTPAASPLLASAKWLAWGIVIVIGLQLLPLPYSIWASLTGSDAARETLAATGLADGWRALSLDYVATAETAAMLVPPLVMFWLVASVPGHDRTVILVVIGLLALTSAMLGLLQYSSGTGSLFMYDSAHNIYSPGFFANRNHQADMVLIGALLVCAALRMGIDLQAKRQATENATSGGLWQILMGLLALIIVALAIFAGASRTGLAMAVPVLACAIGILLGFRRGGRTIFYMLFGIMVLGLIFFAVRPELFASAIGRFDADGELRFQIWPLIVQQIGTHLPFGSGLGSFVPVFMVDQPLDMLNSRFVNHAHNDYLEIALELGVFGIALLLAFFVWLFAVVTNLFRQNYQDDLTPMRVAAVAGIFILLFHSTVDYSLRTTCLAVVFAALLGFIMPPAKARKPLFPFRGVVTASNADKRRKVIARSGANQ